MRERPRTFELPSPCRWGYGSRTTGRYLRGGELRKDTDWRRRGTVFTWSGPRSTCTSVYIPWRDRHVNRPRTAPCQSRQLIRNFVIDRHRSALAETNDMLAPLLETIASDTLHVDERTGVRGYHQSEASSNCRADRVMLTQHAWCHQPREYVASVQPSLLARRHAPALMEGPNV